MQCGLQLIGSYSYAIPKYVSFPRGPLYSSARA